MAIKSSNGKDTLFTEINITPLTDIFLVLLIIMMVVAPTFQSIDNNIVVPEINSGVAVEEKNATVAITHEGRMFLNGVAIADEQQLASELQKIAPTLIKKEVVVRADERTKSSEIMKVMRAAQAAEYEKLTVAGEPLSKKEQKDLQQVPTQPVEQNIYTETGRVGEIPQD